MPRGITITDRFQLLDYGLAFVGLDDAGQCIETMEDNFKANYGCTSIIAFDLYMMIDLSQQVDTPPVHYYMMTLYFLKTYLHVKQFMGIFNIKSDKTARVWLWRVLEIISFICDGLIRMPFAHEVPAGVEFIMSGDGIHFHCNETRTDPDRPFCSEQQSHKFKKAGLSYLVYLSLLDSKIIGFDGPFDAGTGDATIFKDGMMTTMPTGKKMIGDKGFNHKDIAHLVSCPNPLDDEETTDFKNRVGARQEHVNERLTEFGVLGQRFTHNWERKNKHKLCFKACLALVQLSIKDERPLIPI